MWKFTVSAEFSADFSTKKLGDITVFYGVFPYQKKSIIGILKNGFLEIWEISRRLSGAYIYYGIEIFRSVFRTLSTNDHTFCENIFCKNNSTIDIYMLEHLLNCFSNFTFPLTFSLKSHCIYTTQKMKFFIKDFFSKYDQIRRKLQIWSHLLKKSLMENFTFCTVGHVYVVFVSSSPPNISFARNNKCFIKQSA